MSELPSVSWRRYFAAVLLGELIPILVLIGVVALAGTDDPVAAQDLAQRAGLWVGPVVGAISVAALSMWAGSRSSRPLLQGGAIGLTLAVLDVTILTIAREPFAWVFVASNLGKVAAGVLGGWLASQRRRRD